MSPARLRDLVAACTAAGALLALREVTGLHAVATIAIVACAAAPWARPRLRSAPWGALHGVVLLALAAWALLGATMPALGTLLAWLLAHRVLGRSGPTDERLVVLIAALLLAFAGGRTESPAFFVAWAAVGLGGPALLMLAQLEQASPRGLRWGAGLPSYVAAVPIAGLALALGLFLALPRFRAAPSGAGALAATGFAGELELGDADLVLSSFEPVVHARFAGAPPSGPVYLRGLALDQFDGQRWTTATERGVRAVSRGAVAPPAGTIAVEVRREPLPEGVLFTTGEVVAISHADVAWVQEDAQGNLLFPTTFPVPLSYTLHARPPFGAIVGDGAAVGAPGDFDAGSLALPDLDPRVAALAAEVAGGIGSPWGKAVALRDHLLDGYTYTRAPRDAAAEDPLPVFLFERRSGHCEYFASALAVLARAQGVPARVVNGFAGGDPNPLDGWIVFRKVHAHAWVEVYAPGTGWVPIDATPGPSAGAGAPGMALTTSEAARRLWFEGVLRYDASAQHDLLLGAGARVGHVVGGASAGPGLGLWVLGVAAVGAAGVGWAGLRRLARGLAGERVARPAGKVARAHARARRALAKRGWSIPAGLPPVAAARWVRERAGDEAAPLEELAWLHYRVRFGGADDASLARRAAELAARLDRAASRPSAPAASGPRR